MTSFYPVFSVLVSPVKAFRALAEGSYATSVAPFVLCGLISILVALGVNPIMEAIITNTLPTAENGAPAAMLPSVSPATAPLGVLARWFLQAGFLWLCIQLVHAPVRFSTVLTVVAYSFIVISIGELLTIAVIHLQGVEQTTSPLTLYGDFGLNRLFPGTTSMAVESLLRSVTLFTVWQLALLTIGLTVAAKMKPGRAFLVSFTTWLLPVLLSAASFSFFEKIRSLTM